jgi:hypothetical protein
MIRRSLYSLHYRSVLLAFSLLVQSFVDSRATAQENLLLDCCIPDRWVQVDYLMGWIKDGPNDVPLISTGSTSDPIPAALGQPSTQILAGRDDIDFGTLNGGRLTFGKWIDPARALGWEVSGFAFEESELSSMYRTIPGGTKAVTAPIQLPGGTETSIYALVNGSGGTTFDEALTASYRSQLWGGHLSLVSNNYRTCQSSSNTLIGFRYLNLDEATSLEANLARTLPSGTATTRGLDFFETDASFYGSQLGLKKERFGRWWSLSAVGTIALGLTDNKVSVSGSRTQSNPGVPPITTSGFVFSEPTNIGHEEHTSFSVVPEAGLRSEVWITRRLSVGLGYSALYWNNLVRPGHQIDRVVNPTQRAGGTLVGEARPESLFNRTDLWFHSVNTGITYRW